MSSHNHGIRPPRLSRASRTGFSLVGAAFPAAFLAAIVLVEVLTPAWYFPFSPPLIVVVPALAAATSGVVGSAVFTGLSVLVSLLLTDIEGGQDTGILYAQLVGLAVIFTVSMFPGHMRTRREKTVRRLRSVAEAVQRAVLHPIPERIRSLHVAANYLAAEKEAHIGGDLYDVLDTPFGVRMIIGDVRGKGLPAVASANNLLGAFREAASHAPSLPELAKWLEGSVRRYNDRAGLGDEEFITATLVSVPSHPKADVLCLGHPAPLLIHAGNTSTVNPISPSPPLGLGNLTADDCYVDTITFDVGDRLILYTDGVTEARDANGAFYPLTERIEAWSDTDPSQLVKHLVHDLHAYARDQLGDDAALLAVERLA